jgi:hypothetical protein
MILCKGEPWEFNLTNVRNHRGEGIYAHPLLVKMVGTESEGVGGVRGVYQIAPLGPDQLTGAVYITDMIRQERLWKFVVTHDYVGLSHNSWVILT